MDTGNSKPRPVSAYRPRKRQGRCYELAFKLLTDDPTWTLVHGVANSGGADIGHAWLERDGWVFDPVLNRSLAWIDYATDRRAVRLASFTAQDAARRAVASGHYGPWDCEQGEG